MPSDNEQEKRTFGFDAFDLASHLLHESQDEAPPPEDFGPYKFGLNKRLGEGTLGEVWLADEEGAARQVAVKILREGCEQSISSNEIKNQGRLEHPRIARLYQYGVLEDGRPWIAMEFVDGRRLDTYCRENKCGIAQRLALFRAIAEAVRYAHQKQIDHGDLKPSNILVTQGGEPKLLDFGLARRLSSADGSPVATSIVMGLTPAYAAPELFRGESAGFYGDIYALGVILYELLTDSLPFDVSGLTMIELQNFESAGKVADPPSLRARRKGDAGRFHELSETQWRDLDAICLKAMDRDVSKRYSSVESLIEDLDRFLNHEPVLASKPHSPSYLAGKFFARNRRAVLVASSIVAALVLLTAGFMWRLKKERDRAVAEAARTKRVEGFVEELFSGGEDEAAPAKELRVETILNRGVEQARGFKADPALQADFFETLANVYVDLDEYDRAEKLLQDSLSIRRQNSSRLDDPTTADSLLDLGMLRAEQNDYKGSEQFVSQALDIYRRHLPADDLSVLKAQVALGRVLSQDNHAKEAVVILTASRKELAKNPAGAKMLADATTLLANAYQYLGNYESADALNREALAVDINAYGTRHPMVAVDLINIGQIQEHQNQYPEAEKSFRQALDIDREWYGADSVKVADAATYVGQALEGEGRLDEAEQILLPALATMRMQPKPPPIKVAILLGGLGTIARDRKDWAKAEADFTEEAKIFAHIPDENHQFTAIALANLASIHLAQKRFAEAEAGYRDALHKLSDSVPADIAIIGTDKVQLGEVLLNEEKYKEAETELQSGYQILMQQKPPSAHNIQTARHDLASLYAALHNPEMAAKFQASTDDKKP
jgi:serine/threonine protein kinase